MNSRWLVVLALPLLTGCYRPPQPQEPRLHGIHVEARAEDRPAARGELLAVSADSLWLLTAAAPHAVAAFPLDRVEVRPREGGRLRPHLWATIGGSLTGVGMVIACSAYEGEPACVAAFPVMLVAYHAVGLVARLAMDVDPPDPLDLTPEQLRRFARFPAGLPPGFPRH